MPTPFDEQKLKAVADAIKAIAHPARLKIVDILVESERSVSELCQELGLPQPYVSQQLAILKAHGILSARRDGQQIFYGIANHHVTRIIECVRDQAAMNPMEYPKNKKEETK